jgi:hypothetical protein
MKVYHAGGPQLAVRLPLRGLALLAGLLGGLVNVLVDADHVPFYFFDIRAHVYLNAFHFQTGRFLHPAMIFIALGCLACAGGLLLLDILKSRQEHVE